MKRTINALTSLAVLLTGCSGQIAKEVEPCTTKEYSPAQIFQKSAPSIVVIKAEKSLGSGFVVEHDERYTYILTNSHVVNRADNVMVKWSDDREEKGKVISDHGGEPLRKDLALVRIDALRGRPLTLKEKPPAVGEDVVVIGAPRGLEFSLSRGVLSQVRNKGDFLQIDAPVNPGNSGGPLLDKSGCVIGVVTFKREESEGINFAIGYEPTKHFLDNPAMERQIAAISSARKEPQRKLVPYVPRGRYKPAELPAPEDQGYVYFGAFANAGEHLWAKFIARKGAFASYQLNVSYVATINPNERGTSKRDCNSGVLFGHNQCMTGPYDDYINTITVNCETWVAKRSSKYGGVKAWDAITPGSYLDSAAQEACKMGTMVPA